MTNVDQFESMFRSASKELFIHQPVEFRRVLVLTDLENEAAPRFTEDVRAFLRVLGDEVEWRARSTSEEGTIPALLELVEAEQPDLVCTYRHLGTEGWRWPHTLGDRVEVLTQATSIPIMVLPHPKAGRALEHALEDTNAVMALTDHLTGDHRLVNHAARLVEPGGTLHLAHVEDEATYERYIDAISKISELDTDVARERIRLQLLKEPHDYIDSCRAALDAAGVSLRVEEIVLLGHRLAQYRQLIEAHAIDLLVFNTKDDDQLAMHGLAYPIAVEMRQIPLLML